MLLHGGLLTIDFMFGPMLPALAARRQVIAVELQGHGRTADTDRTMSVDQLADDVAALLAHLGVDEADVLGSASAGWSGGRSSCAAQRSSVASSSRQPTTEVGSPTRTRSPGPCRPMPTSRPCATPTRPSLPIPRTSTPSPRRFRRWSTPRTWAGRQIDLRAVQTPTLVLVGDNDLIRVSDAVEAAELLPHGQLAVLPGTTHMDMTRSPERILAMVVPYLDA